MHTSHKLLIATGIVAATLGSTWHFCHHSELVRSLNHRSNEVKTTSGTGALPLSAGSPSFSQSQTTPSQQQNVNEPFVTLAEETLQKLPKKADLQKLTPEEAHHTPALLMQAAGELGDVAEALQAQLKQAEGNSTATEHALQEGVTFYQKCLGQNDSPESVRALCYSHYRELREKQGHPETQEEAKTIPLSVRSLADFLADR